MSPAVAIRRDLVAWVFPACALAIVGVAWIATRSVHVAESPRALAWAATFDLTVGIPTLFYFLVVRRRGWPVGAVVPVFALTVFLASRWIPAEHQAPIRVLETAAIPLELTLIGYVIWRARRTVGAIRRRGGDFYDAARATLDTVLPQRLAGVAASEVASLYYALGAWRAEAPQGSRYFSYHRRNGYVAIGIALIAIVSVELIAGHFLIALFSDKLAWIVSAVTAYGVLWLVADLQAIRLRPVVVQADRLTIRVGTRWNADVPCDALESVERVEGAPPDKTADYLAAVPIGAPDIVLTFSHPITLVGIYGMRRTVSRVGLAMDDPDRFRQRLDRRRSP